MVALTTLPHEKACLTVYVNSGVWPNAQSQLCHIIPIISRVEARECCHSLAAPPYPSECILDPTSPRSLQRIAPSFPLIELVFSLKQRVTHIFLDIVLLFKCSNNSIRERIMRRARAVLLQIANWRPHGRDSSRYHGFLSLKLAHPRVSIVLEGGLPCQCAIDPLACLALSL